MTLCPTRSSHSAPGYQLHVYFHGGKSIWGKSRVFSSSRGVNFSSFLPRKTKKQTKIQTHKTAQGGRERDGKVCSLSAAAKAKEPQLPKLCFQHGQGAPFTMILLVSQPSLGFWPECGDELRVDDSPTHIKFKCTTNEGPCGTTISRRFEESS